MRWCGHGSQAGPERTTSNEITTLVISGSRMVQPVASHIVKNPPSPGLVLYFFENSIQKTPQFQRAVVFSILKQLIDDNSLKTISVLEPFLMEVLDQCTNEMVLSVLDYSEENLVKLERLLGQNSLDIDILWAALERRLADIGRHRQRLSYERQNVSFIFALNDISDQNIDRDYNLTIYNNVCRLVSRIQHIYRVRMLITSQSAYSNINRDSEVSIEYNKEREGQYNLHVS